MDRIVGFFFPGPFDADRDGDIDLTDLNDFSACALGPDSDHPGGDPCLIHDSDGDADVDHRDFGDFQRSFTGP
jgi:hypothetical protein